MRLETLDDSMVPARVKPRFRGASHEAAAFAALLAWGALLWKAPSTRATVAGCIYGASLTAMFGLSALYHRPNWSAGARRLLRRFDHAAIFVLIAGTYTPMCLALAPSRGLALLAFVSTGALFGVVKSIMFPDAPRYVAVPIYLALGWAVVPLLPAVHAAVGPSGLALLAAGGVAYSVGAIVYWARKPDPFPAVFGYHEIFHLLVVAAAACHFAVVWPVVRGLR